jgi:tetratricopeptide (TPR) repeat protein
MQYKYGSRVRAPKNIRPPRSKRAKKNAGKTAELSSLLFAKGLALHQAGRFSDAEAIYHQIIGMQPDHFDSHNLLGVILCQRGNYAEALRQIDRALNDYPDNVFALNNRGVTLKELKRLPAV